MLTHPLRPAGLPQAGRPQWASSRAHTPARRSTCYASGSPPGRGDAGAGDEKLQDALVDVLNVNIKRSRWSEKLDEGVDAEREKLIAKAQEVKDEIREVEELNKARSDLAFGSALADIDQKCREFEEELKASRSRLEADEADFDRFQRKVIKDRSAGLMFGELYADPELDAKERRLRGQGASDAFTKMEMTAKAEEAQRAARSRLRSPLRPVLFGGLASILVAACVVDVVEGSPSWGQITLYTLIAVSLAITAYQERKFLAEEEAIDDLQQ